MLVLGASGMLGNTVMRLFSAKGRYRAFGTVRSSSAANHLPVELHDALIVGVDATNIDSVAAAISKTKPVAVINCVGIVKQLVEADDPLAAIPLNSLLPHRVARLADLAGARLVHISTDCVFDGTKGLYRESDTPDATDLYGRSKLLGEVDYLNAVTLRTSIIGHEYGTRHGLVDWFLSQTGSVRGYRRAVFSGLPTVELARVIHDHVLPDAALHGVYHVSAEPISKYSLLMLLAEAYGKEDIAISEDLAVAIDRSLDSTRFRVSTGYSPPAWPALIQAMKDFG